MPHFTPRAVRCFGLATAAVACQGDAPGVAPPTTPDLTVDTALHTGLGGTTGTPTPPRECTDGSTLRDAAALKLVGAAHDEVGFTIAPAGDLVGEAHDDLLVAAFGSDLGGAGAGAVFVLEGGPELPTRSIDAPAAVIVGAPGDKLGVGIAGVGDTNGDGFDDLLVGAPLAQSTAGAAYLFHGPLVGQLDASHAAASWTGASAGDGIGRVSPAGDLNGDGHVDFAIGGDAHAQFSGALYLVFGPTTGPHSLAEATTRLSGAAAGDMVARARPVGDLNGDGLDDVVVAAYSADDAGTDAGAVYVIHGPADIGWQDTSQVAAKVTGTPGSIAGHGIDGTGDVDGDGRDDFIVGAPYDDAIAYKQGRAYIVLDDIQTHVALADQPFLEGEGEEDRVGFSTAGVGDANNDGSPDLMVGAKYHDEAGYNAGIAYLVSGPITGSVDLGTDAAARLVGEADRDHAGTVGRVGDLDGNGQADLAVGAREHDGGGELSGGLYVVLCGTD